MGFDWAKYQDGARFKFINKDDTVEGEITRIIATTFGGTADPVPVLDIKTSTGAILSVTASQTVLCSLLAQEAPEVGDTIRITYLGEALNKRPGFNAAKLFDVIVMKRAADAAPAASKVDESSEPF